MSSAIVTVGGNQLIYLKSPLVIGIYLSGTLAHISPPQGQYQIKPRPFLSYLGDTIRHLCCDTTVIVPTNEMRDGNMLEAFARDFPAPFRVLHDNASPVGNRAKRQVTPRSGGIAKSNYTQYLNTIAKTNNTPPSRVLFIDSEVNYRYTPTQTLVLEVYEALTRRQQRQIAFGDMELTPEQAARYGITSRSAASAQRHQLRIASDIERTKMYTEMLERDTASAMAREGGHSGAAWLGRHGSNSRGDSEGGGVLERRQLKVQAERDDRRRRAAAPPGRVSPFMREAGVDVRYEDREEGEVFSRGPFSQQNESKPNVGHDRSGAGTGGGASAAPSGSHHSSHPSKLEEEAACRTRMLAINMEDYSLVALADMITELASSEVTVAEYLRMEPLIEKIQVPFHGTTYYLAMENCDDIPQIQWEKIQVMEEAEAKNRVPDVEEAEEHSDFFK